MTVYHIQQSNQGYWQVKAVRLGVEISTVHRSKSAALGYAGERAKLSPPAKVAVHNEDGSIDFLEHGYGNPTNVSPEMLASNSGSNFPMVEESISNLLSRSAEALLKDDNDRKRK